jgi:signal transduction histidine kinase
MFSDAISKLSLRKKLMILALVGVFLPVLVLTYMQYRSLAELESKTKGAFKDNMRQGLTIVERRMKQRLEDIAAQTLEPIGVIPLFSPQAGEAFEKHFANVKRSRPEIEEIIFFGYSGDLQKTKTYAYVYSDRLVKIVQPEFSSTQSHILSIFEKSRVAENFLDGNHKYLFAHDSCSECPADMRQGIYLFYQLPYPLRGLPSGFAAVFLNQDFVRDKLIARTIVETAPSHVSSTAPLAMAITISDANSQVLYSNAPAQNGHFFESNFDRPFANWKAKVGLRNTNIDDLARDSFLHSAGVTFLVLVFLLGGIALTIRATDREARLAQAKSDFVSNVSHELKTPLSTISLFSEILELGRVKNEEKKGEYYRIIRHESRRLNKTIDNILDFSRIEAGRKKYDLVKGDMAEVVNSVVSTHRYQIINSGFDVQTNIEPDLPAVLIDREAMGQAISNLLDNAIKYSGKVKQISIAARTVGSNLSIEIADQGVGIPRAEQARVFEKFYRVGDGLVHDVKGSGLGLSLVKHIIEAHNGTISVASDVGKGSRFTILLPLAVGHASACR